MLSTIVIVGGGFEDLAGSGISLQSAYLANEYIATGKLDLVLPEWFVPDLAINALYPSRRHLPERKRGP